MNDLEKLWSQLTTSVETSIQKDIDAVKEQAVSAFGDALKSIQQTAASAPQAVESVKNVSSFIDSLKKNVVWIILGIILIVYVLKPKSGRA